MAMLESKIILSTCEGRPCWVRGRRAIFHRWTDSARLVKPVSNDQETDERLQKWSVHGLVEYEDGSMEREWPNMIKFADSAETFAAFNWDTAERELDVQPTTQYLAIDINTQPVEENQQETGPELNGPCYGCAHEHDNEEYCKTINFECENCTVMGCTCKNCHGQNREPKEGTA